MHMLPMPDTDTASNPDEGFDVENVLQKASMAEKVSLLAGKDFWHTTPLPRFHVPSIRFSDGPNGVRGTKFFDGVGAACLPCGTGLAATWDQDLLREAGILIGKECQAKGTHCWLGPTVCIQRSPLGGRGFESMSEDPYATGKLAAAYITGVQSTGVVAAIKHWLANDQEHERVGMNAIVGQRALREIHMLPFQIAMRDAAPGAVMACYNRVNGTHVSESKELLDGVLREDWGFDGLVLSDWFGTYSTAESLCAGLDLEMPGPSRLRGALAELAVSTRKVPRSVIDARARNVLQFVKRASQAEVSAQEGIRDQPEDRQLNRKLAADSVVLLKNDAGILPLNRQSLKKVALIGPNMKMTAFCGGGSASLQPYYTVSPFEGITSHMPPDVEVTYEIGAHSHCFLPSLQVPDVKVPGDGQPGLRMRFYRDPPSHPFRKAVDEVIMKESSWQLMGFSHPDLDKLFYSDIETEFTASQTAQYEFGLAVYGAGKLYINDELVIDNSTIQRGGQFFFGKGTVEEKALINLGQGVTYRVKVEFSSAPSSKLVKPGVVNFGGGAGRLGACVVVDEDVALQKALDAAAQADVTIVCAGYTHEHESEGFDRSSMDLPPAVDRLLTSLVETTPNLVVVTQSGSPFHMLPWADTALTHLHSWFGGNETGNGIADVLFGDVCPSGKLPVTFPRRVEDTPAFLNFGSERGDVLYGEGIYVGYRYYEKVKRDALYPFGHGLSYTSFAFSNLTVDSTSASLDVTNTGAVAGAETVQLYVAPDPTTTTIQRPRKELKGFAKVMLQPGQMQRVEIPLDKHATAFWDVERNAWACERGTYQVLVGSSSQKMLLTGTLEVAETTTWTGL